jgi:xanthine/CO dehydrogenase XdhC/CoxF family maturation factor
LSSNQSHRYRQKGDSPIKKPILVCASEAAAAEPIVSDLRRAQRIAVTMEDARTTLEMMQVVDFGVTVVEIGEKRDWLVWEQVIAAADCPVAILTHFLARDRRYRDRAFRRGVAAYVSKPCPGARLREVVDRLEAGEKSLEVLGSATYSE